MFHKKISTSNIDFVMIVGGREEMNRLGIKGEPALQPLLLLPKNGRTRTYVQPCIDLTERITTLPRGKPRDLQFKSSML